MHDKMSHMYDKNSMFKAFLCGILSLPSIQMYLFPRLVWFKINVCVNDVNVLIYVDKQQISVKICDEFQKKNYKFFQKFFQ